MPRGFVYGPDEGIRHPPTLRAIGERLIGPRRAPRRDAAAQDLGPLRSAGRSPTPRGQPDTYGDRLVKYIPAEVLAFFLAAAAQWGHDDTFLIIILAVAVILTPVLLYNASPNGLRWYAVLFAVVAFCAWAVGTSPNTDRLLGLATSQAPFVLTVAAFVVPALDKALGKALRA